MALAELIKSCCELLFFHFGFVDKFSELEDGHKAFEFLKSHFEKFVAFVPRLGLVEDTLVSDSIGDDDDAASMAMFADDSECSDDSRTKCCLALSVVGDGFDIEGLEIKIIDLVGVTFSVLLSSVKKSVE